MIYSSPAGTIRKADLADVEELAANLRPEDIREIASTTAAGYDLQAVLAFNVGISTAAFTIRDSEDRIMALVGAAPAGDRTGSVWMHGTNRMARHPVAFARHTPLVVNLLHSRYPVLRNWADCRNAVHLKWLQWAGFRFLQVSTTFSNDGTPFVEFFRKGT